MENQVNNSLINQSIKDIRNARIAITVGVIIMGTIITLVYLNVFNVGSLVFIPLLAYIIYQQRDSLMMKKAVLTLQKYIFDDEFRKEYDKKHNIQK